MGVVVRRYIDILTIIIKIPHPVPGGGEWGLTLIGALVIRQRKGVVTS